MQTEIHTKRLWLRRWLPADRDPFAAMNSDPTVMKYFSAPLPREESDQLVERIQTHFDQHGFGLWAVQIPNGAPFIGFVGLAVPRFEAHFTPCVEIGWRLAADHWNRGYATEAASAVLKYGFEVAGLSEIVSFTVPANLPSRRVMEKIGMVYNPADDFDLPHLPAGHPLRRHVLYRKRKE
jgi:RimJ/RimL family protein N-acetyltransferase